MALECLVTEPSELKFNRQFLALDNQVGHEFRFNHTLDAASTADRRRREAVRAIAQQEARLDCYLLTPAIEVKYLTQAAAQARFIVLPDWFKTSWWFTRGLVVDNVPYFYYACERMLGPGMGDWQFFLNEYIVLVEVA